MIANYSNGKTLGETKEERRKAEEYFNNIYYKQIEKNCFKGNPLEIITRDGYNEEIVD